VTAVAATGYISDPRAVTSVEGRTGAVDVTASDVGADPSGTATAAVSAHAAAADPHADRAFTTSAVSTHAGASDPHGDRAFATSSVATHTAASDPHADRAFTTSAVSTHAGATDPHGDRAFTTTALASYVKGPAADAEVTWTWTAANRWLRINTPYSSGDTNTDMLRVFNGVSGTQKVWWLNGNGEMRGSPSTGDRVGIRAFEFTDGSTDIFFTASTNPASGIGREDLLYVRGSLASTRPGWAAVSRGLEAPDIRLNGASLLPSSWTAVTFPTNVISAAAINDGNVSNTGAPFTVGSQYIPALNRVFLRGAIFNNTGGSLTAQSTLLTLDSAHRPAKWVQTSGRTSTNLACQVTIKTTGVLVISQALADQAFLPLDGISFSLAV
jgi:hypothetical protein